MKCTGQSGLLPTVSVNPLDSATVHYRWSIIKYTHFDTNEDAFMECTAWRCCLLLLCAGFGLCACGPQYEIRHSFQPPATADGLVCTQHCQTIKAQCSNDCRADYTRCAENAWLDAKLTLPTALQIYAVETAGYSAELAMYQQSQRSYIERKSELESKRDKFEVRCAEAKSTLAKPCKERDRINARLKNLRQDYHSNEGPLANKPVKPNKPDLNSEANYLISQRCHSACPCEQTFRACYQQCGGQIYSEKICVNNCK